MSECLFWVPQITAEFGPDLDILSRCTLVQSGVPAVEDEEWPDAPDGEEIDHLKRVQEVARAIRTNVDPEQGWYEQFQKHMRLHDPEWTWHAGYVPPPLPSGNDGGSSFAADRPRISEQRYQRMREDVYKSP